MSHIVTIKTEIRDRAAVLAAAVRLKLPVPVEGKHKLWMDGRTRTIEGMSVELTEWSEPAICNLRTGEVHYDNDNGGELNKFKQAYAVEKAKIEARKAGHLVTETALPDGKIKLTLSVMGGAA